MAVFIYFEAFRAGIITVTFILPAILLFRAGFDKFQALFQLEFHVTPGAPGGFPTSQMNERMTALRRAVAGAGGGA